MRIHLRACAAVLPLVACHSIAPAKAQTAAETVAFIVTGVDPSRAGDDNYGRRVYETPDDETVTFESAFPNGFPIQSVKVTETGPCQFQVEDDDWMGHPSGEQRARRKATIDFTNIGPGETTYQFDTHKPTDPMAWVNKTYVYYKIPGVRVCSQGDNFKGRLAMFERYPESGTCRNELQTYAFVTREQRNRMDAAISYLRSNICKGRAF